MSARARRWPWLAVGLLVGLIACGPDDPMRHVYFEDFELACETGPCGWERTSGAPDQAVWVETIHPGEHGLRLTGDVTVRGPAAAPMSRVATFGPLRGRIVARCDAGSRLRVTVLLNDASLGLLEASADVRPGEEWEAAPFDASTDPDFEDATVSAVVIGKSGAGSCEIGELVLDDFDRFFDGGCT